MSVCSFWGQMPSGLAPINDGTSWRCNLDPTDVFSSTYVLVSSCRRKHRLSRLESFTKRVSKRKRFTSAAFSQAAAPPDSRWPLGLCRRPWPWRHPLPSQQHARLGLSSLVFGVFWLPTYSFFFPCTTFRLPELVSVSMGVQHFILTLLNLPSGETCWCVYVHLLALHIF